MEAINYGKKLLFTACVIFLVALKAEAATIAYSNSWSITPTPNAGPIVLNQNFERFDPALGTLTQVEWSVNASLAAHFIVKPEISFSYDLSATIKCSIEGIACEDPFNPSSETKSQTLSGSVSSFFGPLPTVNRTINLEFLGNVTTAHPSDLSFFTSMTPLTLELMSMTSVMAEICVSSPFQGTSCFPVSLYELTYDGDYNGTLSYTYTYDPVPIPPAIWLFGSGLIGLIGIARREKA